MSQSAPLVMVVDDSDDVREALCAVIEDEGYRVTSAAHGEEALELLRTGEAPLLIFLDLMMPVMDGWELIRLLQDDPDLRRIPIVILTASWNVRAGTPASIPILQKPVCLDGVVSVLRQYG
jgi:CheY-like chemotaxis protein